jgi:hypothetical protein
MESLDHLHEYLIDALTGGEGYLLDCFLQSRDPSFAPWQDRILAISRKCSTKDFPIGISNPEAREELWAIVNELRTKQSGTKSC